MPLKNRQSYYILLGLHLVMGILFLNNLVGKIITLIITIAAITDIILNSNKKERVLFWVVYFISAEVFFRMTSSLVSWEMIKYVSALLFFIGILSESKTPTFSSVFFLFMFYYYSLVLPLQMSRPMLPFECPSYSIYLDPSYLELLVSIFTERNIH